MWKRQTSFSSSALSAKIELELETSDFPAFANYNHLEISQRIQVRPTPYFIHFNSSRNIFIDSEFMQIICFANENGEKNAMLKIYLHISFAARRALAQCSLKNGLNRSTLKQKWHSSKQVSDRFIALCNVLFNCTWTS